MVLLAGTALFMKFNLRGKIHYPSIFGVLALAVWILWDNNPRDRDPKLLITALTTVGALVFFLYQRHEKETEIFRSLFKEFNARYDGMNNELRAIDEWAKESDLTTEQLGRLDDYFNLCAKEFLYFEAGFIDEKVWKAWHNGMRVYLKNSRIRDHWQKEFGTDSYYGFNPDNDYI